MSREKLPFHVGKGCLIPGDDYVTSVLRRRKFKVGDLVFAILSKPRTVGYNKLGHRVGQMCQRNIKTFEDLDAHDCLKRLQVESGVECDIVGLNHPEYGWVQYRVPRSLSFDNMGEEVFRKAVLAICRFIGEQYWPGLSQEQVAEMAEQMPDEV